MTFPSKPTVAMDARSLAAAADSRAILLGPSHKASPTIDGIRTALSVFRRLQTSPVVDTIAELCATDRIIGDFLDAT
jgi:hypothetical protein